MTHAAGLIHCMAAGLTLALLCDYPYSADAQERPAAAQGSPPLPATASEPQGFIDEPGRIVRAVLFADRNLSGNGGGGGNGFFVETGNMISGAGWISGGPGYRRWFNNDELVVETSAGISWRQYKMVQARVEAPAIARSRLTLGSQVRWQDLTQVNYFGEGPDALETNQSEYRLKSRNVVGYATVRPVRWMSIGAQAGWLKPSILPRAGSFMRKRPNTQDVFRRDIVFALPEQPGFVYSEVSMTADTRDFPDHTLRGALVRAAAANYADRDTGVFSFRRYEGEAAGFVPLADGRVVLALHGWLVGSDTDEGGTVPFYLQPGLGGHNTLRGYANYRFHDRNSLLLSVETRIAMMTHVDAAFFVDAGNVAAHVGDLNVDKRSYGGGLRLHSRRQTFARVDLAFGDEGWRFVFRMNDAFNLSRLSRRTAPAPFVP